MAFSVAKAASWIHSVHKARAVVGWWPAQYTIDDERTAYKVQDAVLKKLVPQQGPLVGYKIALPQFRSIVVRAGTPPDVVKKLSDALAKVYASPEYKKFLEDQFADPNSFEDAAKAPAFVNEQLNDMKKTIATN